MRPKWKRRKLVRVQKESSHEAQMEKAQVSEGLGSF